MQKLWKATASSLILSLTLSIAGNQVLWASGTASSENYHITGSDKVVRPELAEAIRSYVIAHREIFTAGVIATQSNINQAAVEVQKDQVVVNGITVVTPSELKQNHLDIISKDSKEFRVRFWKEYPYNMSYTIITKDILSVYLEVLRGIDRQVQNSRFIKQAASDVNGLVLPAARELSKS